MRTNGDKENEENEESDENARDSQDDDDRDVEYEDIRISTVRRQEDHGMGKHEDGMKTARCQPRRRNVEESKENDDN